ncbi:MAG: hypothetical protein L0Z48_10615 [candidate division Zixibacteria bacterium]|nr:hypothetical protein [candidate division Zixibacteria bacterium]
MSQRHSEYARKPGDCYVTPPWVWEALYSVEPWARTAFDCAPEHGGYDFLADWAIFQNLATNPPYGKLAEKFVRHALDLPAKVNFAFLLPHAWDAAKGRVDLFKDQRFKCKHTLVERIRWANLEQKPAGPSTNHAWYVWRAEPRGFIKPAMGWLEFRPMAEGVPALPAVFGSRRYAPHE